MDRRSIIISLAVLVALVAVVALLPNLLGREQEDQAEQQASKEARSRPRATPSRQVDAFGSGGVITTDWYQIFFTAPRYPDNPADHQGGLDQQLVGLMDRASKTLDVADYDFDLRNVADAMSRARKRGVRVRMVTDTDTLTDTKNAEIQTAFKVLKDAGIPIVDDKRGPIMHDKFTVVDGEWVSTGSWNYTDGDTYHLNNWMGIFHSRDLAENYADEFEQMFGGKFGPNKARLIKHADFKVGSVRVQNCFSPPGKCDDLIIRTIREQAKQSLQFLAFSFTHDGIGQAIVERAKTGVKTVGVFETTGSQTAFSEFGKMKKEGLEVYTDANPWVMHHKVILLDDRVVIAGSFNFSANATNDNDENLLILEDPAAAKGFRPEFEKILELARNPPVKK